MSEGHYFEIQQVETPLADLQRILPSTMTLLEDTGRLLLARLTAGAAISEEQATMEIIRECDRVRFLTGDDLHPQFSHTIHGGRLTARKTITGRSRIHCALDPSVTRQNWSNKLALQLRLWFLAEADIPIQAKLNLFFQIIEAQYPEDANYPEFRVGDSVPHPLTEAKFLRHLASHGYNPVGGAQLRRYCQANGLTEDFADPTNARVMHFLESKLNLMKNEADKVIRAQIT